MQHLRTFGFSSLLALSLLSACAAADPSASAAVTSPAPQPHTVASGVFGDFLTGRFALSESEPATAADAFLKALAARPGDPDLIEQAFLAAVMSGRSEAVQLARQLPDNPIGQLVLADQAARAGDWAAAAQHFSALPQEGLTQLLRPLLMAWAQAGAGHTDAALATLRPFVQGQRFRGMFALHAAMIADIGGRQADAAQLYATARTEMPQMNLRLAQILSSWDARSGHPVQAQHTLAALSVGSPDMTIALPALVGLGAARPVPNAIDGIAETYLALGGALRAQDSRDYAMLMLRLALDLRPELTAARVLGADLLATDQHDVAALQMLAPVGKADPLIAVVRLRRAGILAQAGRTDEAMHDLDRIATDYPDSALPAIRRGDILRARQHFGEAIAAYTAAIGKLGQHPGAADWPVFYDRGIAYEQTHQARNAEADFRHALQLSPDQPYVLNYLGYSWADRGEHLAEAREMIQKAAARRPNDGAITDSLGWVMLRQGEVADAVGQLQRAVELEPEDPTINGHLGDAYFAAGRKLEAEYQWRRALTLNPGPEDSAKLEAKLQTTRTASAAATQ